MASTETMGNIFNIQRYSLHDGAGIRSIVFFKGCPLRCAWCHNPESLSSKPQLLIDANKCMHCGRCAAVCRYGAMSEQGFDRQACTACGACAEICPTEARTIAGRRVSVDEVCSELKKDSMFYRCSEGGVTFSGGEPLAQPIFAQALSAAVRASGMALAIETSGYADWPAARAVFSMMDEILFDIKLLDREKHRQYTGVDNAVILENARRAAGLGKKMIVRKPLIGGVNDNAEEMEKTALFAREIGVEEVHLLVYHKLGEPKYRKLGKPFCEEFYTPEDETVKGFLEQIRSFGLCARQS